MTKKQEEEGPEILPVEEGLCPGISPRDKWFRHSINAIIGGLYRVNEGPWGIPGGISRLEVATRINLLIRKLTEARDRLLHGPPPDPQPGEP